MKKSGFTLAEVLITMGIIGVIAALTLPTLSNNAQMQANAAKLASTVSDLESAFGAFLLDKDEIDLHNILHADDFNDTIAPYLKTMGKISSISSVYESNSPFKNSSGNTYSFGADGILMTKSGAIVFLEDDPTESNGDANGSVDTYYGDLHIDVNGSTKPNRIGKDLFSFHLGTDGNLYPMGNETKNLVKNGYKVK